MKWWAHRILLCLFLGVVTTLLLAWGSALWSRTDNFYILRSSWPRAIVDAPGPLDLPGPFFLANDQQGFGFRFQIFEREPARIVFVDFMHYVLIARLDEASARGDFLLRTPSHLLVEHSQSPRLQAVLARAQRTAKLNYLVRTLTNHLKGATPSAADERYEDVSTVIGWMETGWPLRCMQGGYRLHSPSPAMGANGSPAQVISSMNLSDQPGSLRLLPLSPMILPFLGNVLLYSAAWWLLLFGVFRARRQFRRERGCCLRCGYDLRGQEESGCPECGWGRGND